MFYKTVEMGQRLKVYPNPAAYFVLLLFYQDLFLVYTFLF